MFTFVTKRFKQLDVNTLSRNEKKSAFTISATSLSSKIISCLFIVIFVL